MSTRASGLADPANGLTASAAISVQRQQDTISASLAPQALIQQGTTADLGGSQANTQLAPGGSTPLSEATLGLRATLNGATPPPTISSSQDGTSGDSAIPVAASSTPTPTATPAIPANVPCEQSSSPLFCVYTVEAGDTLGSIATKFNIKGNDDVTPWDLLIQSNKPDIVSEDDLLQVGQKLRIPMTSAPVGDTGTSAKVSGVVHTVLRSETLTDIAEMYGVTTESIMAVAANGIGDPDALAIGKELIIPNPTRFATPAPAPTPVPTTASGGGSGSGADSSTGSSGGPRGNVAGGPRSASGLIWPVSGPISSYFGPSHPLGIDIDLFSNPNAPIGAAAAGTVTFAGGDPCCSYGYYVIVDHGNGLQTLYGHFSKLSVSAGEKVSQGEILGLGGRTGYATGNHLHFEVHVNGAIVNPLDYLP
jgi:murein DD-endopeptidase MepM/ murein hydrolase activator NlpD